MLLLRTMTWTFVRRSLLKRPFLNLIKVIGLVLSISSLLLISLFLKHELTYDNFHSSSERIYRFTVTSPDIFGGKHFARIFNSAYIPELTESYPGVQNYVRLAPIGGGVVQWEEKKFRMDQSFLCDSTFFEIFDIPLLLGDPREVLEGPGSLVISQSFSRRIFGDQDPIGQILTIPTGRYHAEATDFVVTGVMQDLPDNSHMHPEFVTTPLDRNYLNGWSWTYLLFQENASPEDITSSFREFFARFYEQDPEEVTLTAHLQKITDIHLHSQKTREIEPNSNILVVYSFVVAAVILLFIALINYFNLNLGMEGFSERFRFISRVNGTSRSGQLKHFITEGVVIVLLALIVSMILCYFTNSFIERRFGINLLEGNSAFVLGIASVIFIFCFLAGFIPHLNLLFKDIRFGSSEQNRVSTLRTGMNSGLIVLQYTIGIVLIISVVVIHRQTRLALDSGVGTEKNQVVCVDYVHSDIAERFPEFKQELLNYPSIESVSAMFEAPGGDINDLFRFSMEGYEVDESRAADDYIGIFPCDYSFATLFDLEFLAGSNFSEEFTDNEGSGEYIINETAMHRLRYSDPQSILNKEFQLFFHTSDITLPAGRITGVVKDFHISSLKREIEPLVFFKRKDIWIDNLLISFAPGMQAEALRDFRSVWEKMFPAHTFRFEYVDSMYKEVYLTERLQAILLLLFTAFALFIGSMGLLGLSLLATQRRKKEIGIRIVNGADLWRLMRMLNWDFLKWILLAYVLAIPLAYLAMRRWLEDFVYKTELSWWIFLAAGVIAILIAGLTVSIHSWKAATRNPVEALRYE